MTYMLDTNICIYSIKHKPERVFRILSGIDSSDVCISSITYAELVYGVEKSVAKDKNMIALMMLLSDIEIVKFDDRAASEYGDIRADLEKKGTPIGQLDMLIAGHARSLGLTLVTNNEKEFSRVEGLNVDNWAV